MTTVPAPETPSDRIIGRSSELAAVRAFLDDPRLGPRALIVAGDAGIGKTTVWEAAIDAASTDGASVLVARPTEMEASLALSGLGDLLEPIEPDALSVLAPPLRRAVEVALLRRSADDADGADHRTLGTAVLHVLREEARSRRVVLGIDDVQWLDAGSAAVLRYALRRLSDAAVLVVAALRTDPARADPMELGHTVGAGNTTTLEVGPLAIEEIGALVREHLGTGLPRPDLADVHAASGGNPFFALEIVRSLQRDGRPDPGGPIPIPRSLREAVQRRLLSLSDAALEVLLVAATVARPTLDLLGMIVRDDGRLRAGLAEAERSEIVRLAAGRVRFTHPLLASTVVTTTPALVRQELHRRLGRALPDPEERALHRALGTAGADPDAVAELERAAERAVRRGAPDAAARLLEAALRLLPPDDPVSRRRLLLSTAEASRRAGAARRSQELLRDAIAASAPGAERARARRLLAEAVYSTDGPQAAIVHHTDALAEPEADAATRAASHIDLAWYQLYGGDPAAARTNAELAVTAAESTGDEVLVMRALDAASHVAFCLATPDADALMKRALQLETRHGESVYPEDRPSATLAQHLLYRDDLDEARRRFRALADDAVRAGDESGRCTPAYHLSLVELAAGDWPAALRHAVDAHEILHGAERTGEVGSKLWAVALIEAHLGRLEDATRTAAAGLASAERAGAIHAVARLHAVRGFVHLSAGDPARARDELDVAAAAADRLGFGEPGFFRFGPDHIEALVGVGALDEAEAVARELVRRGRALDRDWAVAAGERGLALVAAGRGDLEGAAAASRRSAAILEHLGQPFELARSLLVLGVALRRSNRRRDARVALTRARTILDDLGAAAWLARADAEIARIGGRTPASDDALTDTERQVAAHVARGLRNREIADLMFVSVRTVEANLSRIYAKLGVRSRTELARRVASD